MLKRRIRSALSTISLHSSQTEAARRLKGQSLLEKYLQTAAADASRHSTNHKLRQEEGLIISNHTNGHVVAKKYCIENTTGCS